MPNLFTIETRKEVPFETLLPEEKLSILYHNLFDFPMNFVDLVKWKTGPACLGITNDIEVVSKNGYYFISGKESSVYKRMLRKRISEKKVEIAKRAAKLLSFLPGIKMIGVTGSLAMQNAEDGGDVDLMIITKHRSLWTTRLFSYMVIHAFGLGTRKPNDSYQKDKLCLNMWLDESDLIWHDRNIYSAHEIAQIIPLVNKERTFEKFLFKNSWIRAFWPNAIDKKYMGSSISYIGKGNPRYTTYNILYSWLEKLAFKLQYEHMRSKITRETVTPTRALFHPQDWGKVVLGRLTS